MSGTIQTLKTKNQIFKDFISWVNGALAYFSVSGWQVKRLHQVIKSEDLKPCILVQIMNKHQRGTQYTIKTEVNGEIITRYKTKQEVTVRFSATNRNKITETTATLNSADVLEIIKNYMQSDDGILALSAMGYAQYRATDVNEQSFENDDENVQFMPFFENTFLYTDEWITGIDRIDKTELTGIYDV